MAKPEELAPRNHGKIESGSTLGTTHGYVDERLPLCRCMKEIRMRNINGNIKRNNCIIYKNLIKQLNFSRPCHRSERERETREAVWSRERDAISRKLLVQHEYKLHQQHEQHLAEVAEAKQLREKRYRREMILQLR